MIHTTAKLVAASLISAVAAASKPAVRDDHNSLVFQTDQLSYAVGTNGLNISFKDVRTGKNYLSAPSSAFISVEKQGKWLDSTVVRQSGAFIEVLFGDSEISARFKVKALPRYLTVELVAISDPAISSVRLAALPLQLTRYISRFLASARDDEYAAAIIPLNLETHTEPAQDTRVVLRAYADRRVRLKGTKIAIVGCATKDLLDRIEQIEIENGLPHPKIGGIWARRSPEQRKSYLFVDLSEATAPAMIDYAKTGAFGYIVVYDGVWNASHGTYPVNRENFPNGEAGLKAVSTAIHAAGLKFGMHNLDMVVAKTDALVTPLPQAGFQMYPDRRRILALPIGPHDTFIPTTGSTAGLLTKADKSRFHGRDLRIGDEIVVYDDLQTNKPYGFKGCERGAHGTIASPHAAGTAIENFSEFIGFYRPDVRSSLYNRVAKAEADALNRFHFDYIYPDGTGENLGFWPDDPIWYAENLLVSKLFRFTRREVMFAHSPISDYSWHVFSRGNTTDFAQTGMLQHFDRMSLAGVADSIADMQPFEFGWFGFFDHQIDADATRPREMEYAWSKALAYGAAMSLETTKAALDGNGRTREIFSNINNWERLKLANYFSPTIREQVKVRGREFSLEKTPDGNWRILPVIYEPTKRISNFDNGQNVWSMQNPYKAQPLRVTIEATPELAKFGDDRNIALLGSGPLNLYTSGGGPMGRPARQSPGMEYRIRESAGISPDGEQTFEVAAVNSDRGVPVGWGCAEAILNETKDLTLNRGLGAWVEGDGSGAFLHFTLEDRGRWNVRDYPVRLDFTGWKYIQIPEPAKGEVYDFEFPYSNYWAIRSFDYRQVSRVYIFISNVPRGHSIKARFGWLKALRETGQFLQDPSLTVNGQLITFRARLETNWYLELAGAGTFRLFDADGFLKAHAVLAENPPIVREGLNQITFTCDRSVDPHDMAKITIEVRGSPLR